jgi:hypothetical protein
MSSVEHVEAGFRALGGKWGKDGDVFDEAERKAISLDDVAFTYGEVLPVSVRQLMDGWHLGANRATTMVDLGFGKGRLVLQTFLEHRTLTFVVAVEFSKSRYKYARNVLVNLAKANPHLFTFDDQGEQTCRLTIKEDNDTLRHLELRNQDLFDCRETFSADIVVCETAIPVTRQKDFTAYLAKIKPSARLLLYHRLCDLPHTKFTKPTKSTAKIDIDILSYGQSDKKKQNTIIVLGTFREVLLQHRYRTSWSTAFPFDIWIKL